MDVSSTATTTTARRVTLIATGGTIASAADRRGDVVTSLSPDALLSQVGSIGDVVDLRVDDIVRVNGWDMTPAVMVKVARAAARAAADGMDGVVITHGTDTMEETALLVDIACRHLTTATPIVLTGAMHAANERGADGIRNLEDSLAVVTSPVARSQGALIVMHGEIYRARRAAKRATVGMLPFRDPYSCCGQVLQGQPNLSEPPPDRAPSELGFVDIDDRVATVFVDTGGDAQVIGYHIERGIRGLVIVGTGAGNVPAPYAETIEHAMQRGVAVVATSRAVGPTAPIYGGPGGNSTLRRLGVIDACGLSPGKARVALMAALGSDIQTDVLQDWFSLI